MTFGTLAQAPLEGGAPREVARDVLFADWAPDGKDLAVVRLSAGKTVLEFPIGKKLYETDGFVTYPRVSPQGDRVAFLDHPTRTTTAAPSRSSTVRGSGARSPGSGPRRRGWPGIRGARRSGSERPASGEARAVWAVSLSGRERVVASAPGNLAVQDVLPTGASS